MKTKVIKITDDNITDAAREAAQAIQDGKLVGFPTETVYGIAVDATNFEAVARLRDLKSRPEAPFSLHLGTPGDLARYIKTEDLPLKASRLIERSWPGPVTPLIKTPGHFADDKLNQIEGLFESLTMNGILGLRCPDELFTQYMLSMAQCPVIAPSANLKGQPSPRTGDDVLSQLDGKIDLLIDIGQTKYGQDSSIVKFEGDEWSIVRQGVFNSAMLSRMMSRKIAFVCTGNTCRSPMAEGIAKVVLAKKYNCSVEQLQQKGIEVISAGAMAYDGDCATEEAEQSAKKYGADISEHRSMKLTPELLKTCDLVFCMTHSHLAMAEAMSQGSPPVITLLDNAGIPDPIGGSAEVYDQTAAAIESAILKHLENGKL